jgi:hypothetical protein
MIIRGACIDPIAASIHRRVEPMSCASTRRLFGLQRARKSAADTLGNGELGLLPRAATANRDSEEQARAK